MRTHVFLNKLKDKESLKKEIQNSSLHHFFKKFLIFAVKHDDWHESQFKEHVFLLCTFFSILCYIHLIKSNFEHFNLLFSTECFRDLLGKEYFDFSLVNETLVFVTFDQIEEDSHVSFRMLAVSEETILNFSVEFSNINQVRIVLEFV
mgnify:CR=1 FL=1